MHLLAMKVQGEILALVDIRSRDFKVIWWPKKANTCAYQSVRLDELNTMKPSAIASIYFVSVEVKSKKSMWFNMIWSNLNHMLRLGT